MSDLGALGLVLPALAPLPAAWWIASRHAAVGVPAQGCAAVLWWCLLATAGPVVLGWAGWFTVTGFITVNLLLLAVGALGWLHSAPRLDLAPLIAAVRQDPALRLALLLLGLLGSGLVLALPILPTADWDSHLYQLPLCAEWLHAGSFAGRSAQWTNDATFMRGVLYYPGSWNTLTAEALALTGHVRWSLFPGLMAMVLLVLATAVLARIAGAARGPAALAAVLAAALPITQENLHSAHIDLPFAALVCAGFAGALIAGRTACPWWTASVVAAAGLALGIKQSGMWLAPLILLVLTWAAWCGAGRHACLTNLRQRPWALLLALCLAFLLGGSWYLRNVMETGNPTGFVAMLGLPGVVDGAYLRQTSLLHAFHPTWRNDYLLVGGALLLYAWPVLLLGLSAGWRPRPLSAAGRVLLGLVGILIWLHISGPWSGKHAFDPGLSWWLAQQLRYLIAGFAVALAVTAALHRSDSRWIGALAIIAVLTAPWHWPVAHVSPWLMGALGALLLAMHAVRWTPRRIGLAAGGLALAMPLAAWGLTDWRQERRQDLFDFTNAAAVLDAIPEDQPIAAWGMHHAWLVHGERGRRRIVWLDLDRCGDADAVAAQVRASGCRWLVIGETVPRNDSRIHEFITWRPQVFTRHHGELYRWGISVFAVAP